MSCGPNLDRIDLVTDVTISFALAVDRIICSYTYETSVRAHASWEVLHVVGEQPETDEVFTAKQTVCV